MMEVIICNLLIDESDPQYYWNVLVFLIKKNLILSDVNYFMYVE